MAAKATGQQHKRAPGNRDIYRNRSGFPNGLQAARGATSKFEDFSLPAGAT
jgi:hypothetical protein